MEYDDKLIIDMVSAWPEIEQLHLNEEVLRSGWKTLSMCATTLSIYVLSQACPRLLRLGILLDARGAAQLDEITLRREQPGGNAPLAQPRVCTIRWLSLRQSLIDSPIPVARMLSRVLPPRMTIIRGRWAIYEHTVITAVAGDEEAVQWVIFAQQLPLFRQMREDKRSRARANDGQ